MKHTLRLRITAGFLLLSSTNVLPVPSFTLFQWLKATLHNPNSPEPAASENAGQLGYLQLSGSIINTDKFHEALKKCMENIKIKGIIIKIDAEWGTLGLCQAMFLELREAAKIKPVIALTEKACCREPYLVASAANYIIANEQSIVGMIGTTYGLVEQKTDPSKEIFYFYAGRLTPLGDPHHHITSDEQLVIASNLEKHYKQLCEDISQQRNLPLEMVSHWAEGRPFTGKDALGINLIDQIGTLSTAYTVMEQLLQKRNTDYGKFELVPYCL